jgi:CBS domain-containing protein
VVNSRQELQYRSHCIAEFATRNFEIFVCCSIIDCMETFSKGVHRALVPIESQANNSLPVELVEASPGYKMLTQMDVIRFLRESSNELKDILSSSIQALGAINENIFAITKNTKVGEAIKTMRAVSLTAVPVVDADEEESLQDVTKHC